MYGTDLDYAYKPTMSTMINDLPKTHAQEYVQNQIQPSAPTVQEQPPVMRSTPVQQLPLPIMPVIPQAASIRYYNDINDPNYMDSVVHKRRDVLKAVILAITIVLAISIHAAVDFWLKEIFINGEFGFKEELGIRLLYPVVIIIIIWLLKVILFKSK